MVALDFILPDLARPSLMVVGMEEKLLKKGLMALTLGGLRVVWTVWCRFIPFRLGTGVDTLN